MRFTPATSPAHQRLCPVCGELIHLIGSTTDGRLIGSCQDAFLVTQWEADDEGDDPAPVEVAR